MGDGEGDGDGDGDEDEDGEELTNFCLSTDDDGTNKDYLDDSDPHDDDHHHHHSDSERSSHSHSEKDTKDPEDMNKKNWLAADEPSDDEGEDDGPEEPVGTIPNDDDEPGEFLVVVFS